MSDNESNMEEFLRQLLREAARCNGIHKARGIDPESLNSYPDPFT